MPPSRRDDIDGFLRGLAVAVDAKHLRALARKGHRGRLAVAPARPDRTGADHHRCLALEPFHRLLSLFDSRLCCSPDASPGHADAAWRRQNRPFAGCDRPFPMVPIIPKSPAGSPCHGSQNRDQCAAIKDAAGQARPSSKRFGGSMAADKPAPGKSSPNDDVVAVSDEALQQGRSLHRSRRRRGQPADGLVGTDLDHHRRGHEPVPPLCGLRDRSDPGTALHPCRLHAGAELPAVSAGDAVSQPGALVGRGARPVRGGDHRLCAVGRRGFYRPRHLARTLGRHRRHRLHHPAAGGDPPHHRADHAGGGGDVHRLCDARPASAGAVDPSRLRPAAAGRPSLHHAGRHFRRRGRRLGDADHPVHDLRRVPAAIRRRQILHRLFAGADGRQAEQRRAHRGAVVVPARRPLRIGRRHHRDDRHRRLSDAGQGRLREERRRRIAGGRRARRHPVAAGAGRRRVPDRRVPQDQLSRRDLDGDDPDLSLLPVAADHGRTGRQEIRRQGRRLHAGNVARPDDAALRLPLHLAARRRRVHGDRLLAVAVGVLRHRRDLRAELPAQGDRAGAEQAGEGAGRRLDRRAERRDHLRLRRHRRRRRDPDRPRPEILVDRDRLCRRQPAADRDLYRADRLDHRSRGAGDRVLHHLRRDRRPRA